MKPVGDLSRQFSLAVLIAWCFLVGFPIFASIALSRPADGLSLLGVPLWFGFLRLGRRLSPTARVDGMLRRGRFTAALDVCDQALAVTGERAWQGARRLAWLNRRTVALVGLGRLDEALVCALATLEHSADPETLGNCALALLHLNRYAEAGEAARLALSLTRERSLLAHVVLAQVMLARSKPAEVEALARAAAEDAKALFPLIQAEHYALCLAALSRATHLLAGEPASTEAEEAQAQQAAHDAERALRSLHRAADRARYLRALYLLELAETLCAAPETRERASDLVQQALLLDRPYTLWYSTQPYALVPLHEDERMTATLAEAAAWLDAQCAGAPGAEAVAEALAMARQTGRPRPVAHSSTLALGIQVVTLGSTFLLLLLWTWHFFVAVS